MYEKLINLISHCSTTSNLQYSNDKCIESQAADKEDEFGVIDDTRGKD